METSFLGHSYHSLLEKFRFSYLKPLTIGGKIDISSLKEGYLAMGSLLHSGAGLKKVDLATLKYCLDRLPKEIEKVGRIYLAGDQNQCLSKGIDTSSWLEIKAKARRRRMFFNLETGELVCLISSISDIDDLVNLLIAYRIEKLKLKKILRRRLELFIAKEKYRWLKIDDSDWLKLKESLGENWQERIRLIVAGPEPELSLEFLTGAAPDFSAAANQWWQQINSRLLLFDPEETPVYFISSNLHSLLNIVSGFINQRQNEIFGHIETNYPDLYRRWLDVREGKDLLRVNDLLYYFSKIYFDDLPGELEKKKALEELLGVKQAKPVRSSLYSSAQLVPVSALANSAFLDPHLRVGDQQKLKTSQALILNINYPLGMSAYFLLKEILENFKKLKGVYVIGKAAILAGQVGDIQLPKVVFDEHSGNTFFIKNSLNENFPFESLRAAILKDQKAISVYGTFLENKEQVESYTSAGFNIIEMEAGPYLAAVAEVVGGGKLPENRVLHLDSLPFDLGIANYASDNPLSKETLGIGSLALRGVESTYLALLAVVQRIIELEEKR
ncbi:hypothetical protein KKD61_04450 [Patescibacteria group bacterium]|nr:hypothetical protein [Patescibacteria group bacterium]